MDSGWTASDIAADAPDLEAQRRQDMWSRLLAEGGPNGVPATVLRQLGIYGGAQGIWVDKDRTVVFAPKSNGVTVGLLHTGQHYPDDMSSDGVIYHYPQTDRPPARDVNEVEATKNAARLRLPVFVIIKQSHSMRNVRLGWVIDWDDESKLFLISFVPTTDHDVSTLPPAAHVTLPVPDDEPFVPFEPPRATRGDLKVRPGQQRFKFAVLKRYGPKCAVCNVRAVELLQAAHLIPKEKNGSDDPRNGLVLCANHHLAFDAGLFTITPGSLGLCFQSSGPQPVALGVTARRLEPMRSHPHEIALTWRYTQWLQRHAHVMEAEEAVI